MTTKKIRPFNRHGGWITPHHFYFPMAQNFLHRLKNLYSLLENKENELRQEIRAVETEWDEGDVLSYIHHLTDDDRNEATALAVATQIFACMAVEAFLNHYGVKRLGEQYYKRNIERLGINQKLETLIAICVQELVEDKDEITVIVKRMFDRRNRLVHPKSKEVIVNGEFSPPDFPDEFEQAEKAVDEMIMFFNKIQEFDESIEIDIPNHRST